MHNFENFRVYKYYIGNTIIVSAYLIHTIRTYSWPIPNHIAGNSLRFWLSPSYLCCTRIQYFKSEVSWCFYFDSLDFKFTNN